MSARRMRRVLAGVVGVTVLAGVALVPSTRVTDAAFTDSESTSASFAAVTLEKPEIVSCTVQTLVVILVGVVFQSVTISWTSPYPASGVRLTATSGTTTNAVPAANIQTSGPVNGRYTHTATLNQVLLESLISNLLGSTTTLTVASVSPGSEWVSQSSSKTLKMALLGLNPTCT